MKLQNESIGIIGGGQMAEALVRGMLDSQLISADYIMVIDPDPARREFLQHQYGIQTTETPKEICRRSRAVILSVKPQIYSLVLDDYVNLITDNQLIISIMAGVPLSALADKVGRNKRIIRVMPNTPALVLEGASAFSSNTNATGSDRELCTKVFSAVGTCVEVTEPLLDAVTGLSGSGPGYVFTIIDALIDGGVLAGLPRNIAEKLVLQTLYGSAKLAMETGRNPAELKAQVTSPGGTTMYGIQKLEEKNIRSALIDAVKAAADRSKELGS